MNAAAPANHAYIQGLTFKGLLLGSLLALCLLCFFTQIFIDGSADNMVPTALAAASTSLLIMYLWRSQAMTTHPITSLALLGFTASSQFVALATQTSSGVAFTHFLRAPTLTFGVLATVHVVAIATHWVFRHFTPFNGASRFLADKFYGRLGVHDVPSPTILWLLSAIGIVSAVGGGGDFGDVSGKFLAAFGFLMWMPFLIPLYHDMLGKAYCHVQRHVLPLMAYALLIVLIAVSKNIRSMMFIGPLQLLFVFIIYRCRTPTPVTKTFITRVAILITVGVLAAPSLSDLMMAMQIVRNERDKLSSTEIIKNTFETFLDKKRLGQYRDASGLATDLDLYDERYLDNPMLDRLSETKFHDNMLFFGESFKEDARQEVIHNQIDKIITIVPQNILDALDLKFKKSDYMYSNGDFYLNQDHGRGLGGFATGSMWADIYVIGGPWFPFMAAIVLLCAFIPMEAFSKFTEGKYISAAALSSTWTFYLYGIGAESISAKFGQITRLNIQIVLIYAISLFFAKHILQMVRVNFLNPLKSTA